MAASGGDDEGGVDQLETSGQKAEKKKAAHRVIFMRHGESEWNRYEAILFLFC